MEFLRSNEILPHYCGDIQKITQPIFNVGGIHILGDRGTATYAFTVEGARTSGGAKIKLRMTDGIWGVEHAELLLSGSTAPVSLVGTDAVDNRIISPASQKPMARVSPLWVLAPVVMSFPIWLFGMYNLVKLVQNRKEGVSIWVVLNPFTLDAFRTENLTAQAIRYRRNVLIAACLFVLVLGVFLSVGAL